MLERLLIAGSGGQGVLTIGKILARVAVDQVPHLTFFPDYGAEVRGGTSHCEVILSSDEIASPLAETVDSCIIMNEPSAIPGWHYVECFDIRYHWPPRESTLTGNPFG